MINQSELWGEYFTPKPARPLTQQERENLSWIPKPLAIEGPRIYQPVGGEKTSGPSFASPEETQIKDEWVLGGIRLLNYQSDLASLQDNILKSKERTGNFPQGVEIPALPAPVVPKTNSSFRKALFQPTESPEETIVKNEFGVFENHEVKVFPRFDESPPLSAAVIRQLMHRSVATILAFYGYDESTDEALAVLTDVACDFLRHFCQLLRVSRDNQLVGNAVGFADVMERTYRDMGLGSILNLRQFYTESVVGRYKSIRKESEKLLQECQGLDNLNFTKFSSGFTPSKMDSGSVENIPEIHFPSSEEGDLIPTFSLDHSTPQMETGLQMLQSLEQGAYASLVACSSEEDFNQDSQPSFQPMSHESEPSPAAKRKRLS